jgi:hypothetical protein
MALELRPLTTDQQLTNIDIQEARQLAIDFTTGFVRTTDLTFLVKDLFLKDFIERYKRTKSKGLAVNSSTDLYFVPGLDYNSRLLAEAGSEDWLRFYTAANNFVFFGFMSGIKNSGSAAADVSATEIYPATVITLLNKSPTLSNMIVRKGKSKAVGSVAEMREATATLEQAVSLLRQNTKGQSPLNINEKELIKAMQEDEFFRPTVETVDDQSFDLPRGARVIFINTPILFRLMLVKANNNKLEILWADPYTGG